MNSKIEELYRQIEIAKREIANCKHDFSDPKFDPETVMEEYGYKLVTRGSDTWGEPEGYRQVQKPRWSRKCKICGFVQFTHQQETVVVKTRPKF